MEPQAPVFRWWGRHPGSGSAVAAAVGAVEGLVEGLVEP